MRSRMLCGFLASGLLLVALSMPGCEVTNPAYCEKNGDCKGGRVCDVVHAICVSPDAAVGSPDVARDGATDLGADAPTAVETGSPIDAEAPIDAEPPLNVEPPLDGGADSAVDAPLVDAPLVDAPLADAAVDVRVPDTRVPDAAGTCGVNGDCTDPTKAFCVGNVCVGCQSAGTSACVAPTPACDLTSGKCVGCTADSQCTVNPTKGFCVAGSCTGCNTAGATGCAARTDGRTTCATTGTAVGQCVACLADAQCAMDPTKGFCVAGSCTGCNTAGATGCAARTDGKTTCATTGTATGQCVACVADTQCTTDPTKGFCVANACTGCNTTGATGCSSRVDGKIVCATTGTSSGQCVECAADSQCTANPAKGFCVANACTGCTAPGATGCAGRTDGKTTCATTGTAAGQCVECTADSQCTANPSKGFCVANACMGCNTAGATGCAGRTDGKTVCASTGTLAGQCVTCVASSDCKVATSPICTSNLCGACTADSQCSAKLGTTGNPGVCLNNIDGHCATDAETVYVGAVGTVTCTDGVGAGAAATPFCTALIGVNVASTTGGKNLVLLTGTLANFSIAVPSKTLTVVGRTAVITPPTATNGIDITSGTVYLRNLTVQGVTTAGSQTGVGINALPGSPVTLYITGCTIKSNVGGILLNGAAFDIENTTVSNNAAGALGATRWGGILVSSLPATGPTILNHVTIQNNAQVGLSCSAPITTSSTVLSSGNITGSTDPADQISGCGFTSCAAAGTGCGAP